MHRGAEGEEKEYRRADGSPLRAKARLLFCTPSPSVPPSSLPLDFLSRTPVRRLPSTNLFFPPLLPSLHPFLAVCTFSQYEGEGGGGLREPGSKQRNVQKGDFNTLLDETVQGGSFINLFRVYVNSRAAR